MKKSVVVALSLVFILLAVGCCPSVVWGQAKSITKEEFRKEVDRALALSTTTFPRRETEINPIKIVVYEDDETKPSETILHQVKKKEFQAKDRIRYEFIKLTTKGEFRTKIVLINSTCYDSDGSKWKTEEISCERVTFSVSSERSKEEFFAESGLIDSKPVIIFRSIYTGKRYANGDPPYIDEHIFYVDSKGRIVKSEHLNRKGDEPSVLQSSVRYDYDHKIKPITIPRKKTKRTKRG